MMVSRRTEPFRYEFQSPISCLIQLYEVNGNQLDSKQGQAQLLDLSPNGCKMDTPLNFRVNKNSCKVILSFDLAKPMIVRGTLLWQEQKAHSSHYGVQFEEHVQQDITEELKLYARMQMLAQAD